MGTLISIVKTISNMKAERIKLKREPAYHYESGCFYGECNVLMNDNTLKLIKNLRANDVVYGGATIECMVKHKCKKNEIILSNINGLLITPYHPILIDNEWVFPNNVGFNELIECEFVYNFVLSHNHILIVNDIKCCTLGHGLKTNDVIKHSYFGTNKIINDLKKMNGWNNGIIELRENIFVRNKTSHLVEGMAL